MKLLGIKASTAEPTERNSYLAKVEAELKKAANSFIIGRNFLLEQMDINKEALTHPYETIKADYDKAYERALQLKQGALQKARAILDAEYERLNKAEETSTLTELQKLNSFNHFANILKTLATMQIFEYGNSVELTETEYFQIKAELTNRLNTADESDANSIQGFLTTFKQTDAKSYLEQAYNELQLMENSNEFPMLPIHLQLQQKSISELLGVDVVNEHYELEHGRQLTAEEQLDEFFK